MTARILIVDDLEPNVRLLEAKLTAEYFDVIGALNGPDALAIARQQRPDVILLDVMMPGMDGYEVCRRLKADPETSHIPVIMVTALDQQSDRNIGLEAGADDFLTKPPEDVALIARVKSLARLKVTTDELRLRELTGQEFGIAASVDDDEVDTQGRLLIVEDQPHHVKKLREILTGRHFVTFEDDFNEAILLANGGDFDAIIVSLSLKDYDGLRLCSQLRSFEKTRNTPIVALIRANETKRLVRALEIGVSDYLVRPPDRTELLARLATQVRRKRYDDRLRANFQMRMEMAVTDQLTGLYNRRYLGSHLKAMFDQALQSRKPLAAIVLDIDHFKTVNDTHGHVVGDEVLREFARRLMNNVRSIDLACRYGGEEFVVIMPDTDQAFAMMVSERLREDMAGEPVEVMGGERSLDVTVSIGVACTHETMSGPQELIKLADEALYRAKGGGRNQVVAAA
ncbi:MAG: PleD family two-component system response regulator [Pseudomonadota bacterium]